VSSLLAAYTVEKKVGKWWNRDSKKNVMIKSLNIQKLKFKGQWRTYQQRVLNELDYHLNDNKLNIVAAPGAGKTTLGIEVLLRLKNPALILAPTITIKNQWKQRIIDNFLPEDFFF